MTGKDRFLVVISVLEGRKFPKRPRHKIIAEARFDGEQLATDPVDHVDNPDFTQELAWELDKKALHQHRLQRTSIKIQCFAYNVQSTLKEAIGYVILDLRSATSNKQVAKWYQILHSKYHKSKPELRLALYLDDDKNPIPGVIPGLSPVRAVEASDRLKGLEPHTLKPVLNEDEGFYQIGPAKKHAEQFVLSITIAYATNLAQLIPSTLPLPAASGGYFFYFSLLGNDVTNESFTDLINPNFPAERASVRLRSSVDALRVFFSSQPGIQVHLCCGDQSLGSGEVPLSALLKKGSTEIYMKPVSIDGAFQLVPPNKTKQQMPPMASDLTPNVGVSVVLRKEDMTAASPMKDAGASPIVKGAVKPQISQQPELASEGQTKVVHSNPPQLNPAPSDRSKTRTKEDKRQDQQQDDGDYTDTFEDENSHSSVVSDLEEKHKQDEAVRPPAPVGVAPVTNQYPTTVEMHGAATPISSSSTQPHPVVPPQSHHFIFSIDLRSIRDHVSSHTNNVFLKYSYPFFGVASPVLTNPPVEIRKGMEVLLPQSFCAFAFACPLHQLQDMFLRVPLIVEIWHRDRQLSKDILLGAATLPLGQIVTADKSKVMNNTGGSGWRQEYADRIPATSTDGKLACMFEVSTVLSLEDWGPLPSHPAVSSTDTQVVSSGGGGVPETSPRETAEYQAALELEMWKAGQEQVFENQLKQKESVYMRALAEEWKKRDREREVLLQKKMSEYSHHEDQLKKALTSLEKRDKQLAANEQEVLRLRSDLQREHERKMQEVKEASHRHKEDCEHRVELERMKVKEMEELVARCKQEISEADRKYKAVEKEFSIYKEQQNTKPEVRLQSEINLLTLEKVELERKLDAVGKSKVHYKQQWGRALKELARLKQREQEVARAQLKKQQQELEHMRLRYLAAEEKDVVQAEKKELEDIKNQLNKLKQLEEDRLKQSTDSNGVKLGSPKPTNGCQSHDLDSSLDEHITRLIEERDTLLKTGAYSTQDKIIAELDRQIREAIVHKRS